MNYSHANKPIISRAGRNESGKQWRVAGPRAGPRVATAVAFTLVEVLVAVAMIGSVMTVLLLARLEAVRQADRARELTRAIRLVEQIVTRMDLPGFDRDDLRRQLGPRLVAGLRWEIVPGNPPDDWPELPGERLRQIRVWPSARPADGPLVSVSYLPRHRSEE